jgi:hypothetical protein
MRDMKIMEDNALHENLRLLAAETDEATKLARRCLVADMVLEIGFCAEWALVLAEEAVAPLNDSERALLVEILLDELEGDLARCATVADRSYSDDDLTFPILSSDPFATERCHKEIIEALVSRERVQRYMEAGALLDVRIVEGTIARLPRIDVGLHALVPRLATLAPQRSRLAYDIPEESPDHWWFTEEAADPRAHDDAELPKLPGWVAEWLQSRRQADGTLKLDADEARALLSTPRGQRLADYLDRMLDVSAAQEK